MPVEVDCSCFLNIGCRVIDTGHGQEITITSGDPAVSRGQLSRPPGSLSLARVTGYSSTIKPLPPAGHFLAAPMRNFLVLQTVHWPVTARRPFFRTTSWASRLSVLLRHLKH